MEKEELEKILSTLPPGTKISVQDELRTYDIEAVGIKSKEIFLIVGDGNVLDLAGLAEMGIQFIGPREIPEEDVANFSLGPLDFLAAGLDPLPEPTPIESPFNRFDRRAEKNLVKKISDKQYPKRTLGLIRGRGIKKK